MPPRKRRPVTAAQLAAVKTPPEYDPQTPVFNSLITIYQKREELPTFMAWETHQEFMIRHQFSQWLYANTYGMPEGTP